MTRAMPTSNMINGRVKPWPLSARPCMKTSDTKRQSVRFISSIELLIPLSYPTYAEVSVDAAVDAAHQLKLKIGWPAPEEASAAH